MFVKFPSINQFRNTVKWAQSYSKYHNIDLPTVEVIGTVKLHGTNGSLIRTIAPGPISACSREREITPHDDNAGFAQWAANNDGPLNQLFDRIGGSVSAHYPADTYIQIAGEWCGGNIQKGVGLNQLPKMFVVFAIRIVEIDEARMDGEDEDQSGPHYKNVWFTRPLVEAFASPFISEDFHHIYEFPTWNVAIDFARPDIAQNKFVELTLDVENRCPVSAQLLGDKAVDPLIGEGIVWTPAGPPGAIFVDYGGLAFKTKGEKHSSSKVKTIAAVDTEKLESVEQFVEYACTESRLAQGIDKLRESGIDLDIKNIGAYIKWVNQDIAKEETDTLEASGLVMKDIGSRVSNKARQYFINTIDTLSGL
jgi:hypothetical protein